MLVFYRCRRKRDSSNKEKRCKGYRSGVSKDVKIIRSKDYLKVMKAL